MDLDRLVHLPRLARLGAHASRELADDSARLGISRALLVTSEGLPGEVVQWVRKVLSQGGIEVVGEETVALSTVREAQGLAGRMGEANGVLALGGGRALDAGKYAASLARVPFVSIPTSLSHDGFASPSASLVGEDGKRVSLPCGGPAGVIVDTAICAAAPKRLTLAGLGDVVAKLSALSDWWLWEHSGEGKVDGVAAAVAESAVAEVESISSLDEQGVERLARGLMLGGVAMGIAGSSRPCSGSEHLVSHALDRLRTPPGSHGVQVGLAAYLCSILQGGGMTPRIVAIYDRLDFWSVLKDEGVCAELLLEALRLAPEIKPGYLTVLSRPGALQEAERILREDPRLRAVCGT